MLSKKSENTNNPFLRNVELTDGQIDRQTDTNFTGSNKSQGNNVTLKYFTISIQINFS